MAEKKKRGKAAEAAEAIEAQAETLPTPEPEKRWYVVHTYSGFENKVKENLDQRIITLKLEKDISKVLVPTEPTTENRKGKTVTTQKKFYPGYILVYMRMTEETKLLVKNTPKVTGFVGDPTNPAPLTQEEVDRILVSMEKGHAKPKPSSTFKVGDKIRVVEGSFANFVGQVDEVNADRGKLKIMVSIFGRPTPVEVDFGHAEIVA